MSRLTIRLWSWLVVLAVNVVALAALARAGGAGSGEGESRTSVGTQRSAYSFADAGAVPVMTPKAAMIDLGPGLTPLVLLPEGTIVLDTAFGEEGGAPARWRQGTITWMEIPPALYRYPNSAGDNLRSSFSPEEGIGGVSRNGLIAVQASAQRQNDSHYGTDSETFVAVWPAGSTTPVAIRGVENVHRNDDDPNQINRSSLARVIAVDRGGGVWVDLDNTSMPTLFINGSTGGDPNPLGPYNPGNAKWIEVFDANSSHQAVGDAYLDDSHVGYYVGTPAQMVDFVPLAINDAGQVVGDDCGAETPYLVRPVLNADCYGSVAVQTGAGNHVLAPFVLASGRRFYLQGVEGQAAIRVSGFDEAGNVYGSTGATFDPWSDQLLDRGQDVIWVADPVAWGLPANTPRYTPVAWETPVLPAGYEALSGVPPGSRRIELGLAARAETGGGESNHGIALVPAQLRVDFNRDGVIGLDDTPGAPDREFADKQLPYFFWVNDDDDTGETGGDDIPGQPASRANAANDHVDGTRDLVDFFPGYLDIRQLLDVLPPASGFTYQLSHQDGALGYVCTDLTPATAGNYLRDIATATALAGARVTPIPPEGSPLPTAFLEQIRTGDKGVILIEASARSGAPLVLAVCRGTERIATQELPLSIDSVEAMFRHVNLCGAAGVTPTTQSRGGAPNWDDRLSSNRVVLFVHGYNVNQQQARGWQAEVFKRLWWAGSRARFWGVTWYGNESQVGTITPDYHSNVVNAFATAPQLASFIAALRSGGAADITVAAHSLGNMVASAAIVDHHAPVARYVMLDAAVAAESFDVAEQQPATAGANLPHTDWNRKWPDPYPSTLWASDWYHRFAADDGRHRLTWADRFGDRGAAAFYNFYSSGEEVLAADEGLTRSIGGVLARELYHFLFQDEPNGTQAWVYQEKLKGRTTSGKVVGSNFGGWGFNTFQFRRAPDVPGLGPLIAPSDMSAGQAQAALGRFTDAVLREVPFFEPGDDGEEVASWVPGTSGGPWVVLREPLGMLYGPDGSNFARRHRDTLLARMIPAMSLAAGRKAVEKLTPPNAPSHSFDMNGMRNGWPPGRQGSDATRDRWLHSDIRDVAFPYVQALYSELVELSGLNSP